jgi:hypothetical protein
MDKRPDYAAYAPSAGELALFARYCGLLPPAFKAAMEERMLGIYFVQGFASGGMTDFCFGPEKDSLYLILYLNPKTMQTSLADWVAYRDASPYAADSSGLELRSSCPGGEAYRGLLQTLVHESAHAYDYLRRATPYITPNFAGGPGSAAPADRDFTRGVWEDYAKPARAYAIPRRGETFSYGLGKAQPLSAALEQYRALGRSPFASFYGSGSWAEDFAEAATWSHLRREFGIGYEVVLTRDGKEELRFSPSESRWSEEMKKLIEDVLRD